MEFLMELLLELVLEGSLEISKSNKISRWIRYPLILAIILLFLFVIGCLFFIGILVYQEHKLAGIFCLLLALFMFVGCICKFNRIYIRGKRL